MNVGDLVKLKHASDVGIVEAVDSNIHDSVTYRVWVSWSHLGGEVFTQYNFQLEVINAQN